MHWDAGHTDDCMIDESIDDPELATALMQSMQETRKKTPPPSTFRFFKRILIPFHFSVKIRLVSDLRHFSQKLP